MYFEELINRINGNPTLTTISLGYTREMQVARFSWGWLIKTDAIDEAGDTVVETLISRDGQLATLLRRESLPRDGCGLTGDFNARDSAFPIGSTVRLVRDRTYV